MCVVWKVYADWYQCI